MRQRLTFEELSCWMGRDVATLPTMLLGSRPLLADSHSWRGSEKMAGLSGFWWFLVAVGDSTAIFGETTFQLILGTSPCLILIPSILNRTFSFWIGTSIIFNPTKKTFQTQRKSNWFKVPPLIWIRRATTNHTNHRWNGDAPTAVFPQLQGARAELGMTWPRLGMGGSTRVWRFGHFPAADRGSTWRLITGDHFIFSNFGIGEGSRADFLLKCDTKEWAGASPLTSGEINAEVCFPKRYHSQIFRIVP